MWKRTALWSFDGHQVACESTGDERITLVPDEALSGLGVVGIRFPGWSVDARRVTLFEPQESETSELDPKAAALLGRGGIDFVPPPGSAAEKREARMLQHPVRHTLVLTAVGVAKVVAPILLGLIALRFAFTLPWPSISLPAIPWPDWNLPSIPWPNVPWPNIPWPDLAVPDWIKEVLSKAKYVWPILLAFVLARAEVRRRRQQAALRNERESLDHSGPTTTTDLG